MKARTIIVFKNGWWVWSSRSIENKVKGVGPYMFLRISLDRCEWDGGELYETPTCFDDPLLRSLLLEQAS